MKHTMLDLETFGTSPGAVIRSIGAVTFDLDGRTGKTFYTNVDEKSCLDVGLFKEDKTVEWWSRQSAEAQKAFAVDPKPLKAALAAFRDWLLAQRTDRLWCQGANFDAVLLEAAYRRQGQIPPWEFWEVRDTRTVYDLFSYDTGQLVRQRVHHNALDDSFHQVALIAAALRKGRVAEPEPVIEDIFG